MDARCSTRDVTRAAAAANLLVYHRGDGYQGTGYPMVRLLALLACGTRTVIDAVFGTDRRNGRDG